MSTVDASRVREIMSRIEVSDPQSGIAVFKDSRGIFSVFGNTIKTQQWIDNKYPYEYIGTYNHTFNPVTVKRELMA